MAPLWEHEEGKSIMGRLVETLTEELDIPLRGGGSTTFRRKLKKRGLEPDECYYIRNVAAVRGKKRISLPRDPPPDLAIEIDITSRSIPRLPIYASLGVPEVWRYNGQRIQCLHLVGGSRHVEAETIAFPMLRPRDLTRFVALVGTRDQTAVIKAFRSWLRQQPWAKQRSPRSQ